MSGEPFPHQVDQVSVAERVHGSGGHLDDVRPVDGSSGGDGADTGDDQVDGDDVESSFGGSGELLE